MGTPEPMERPPPPAWDRLLAALGLFPAPADPLAGMLGTQPVPAMGYDYASALAAGMAPVPVPSDVRPHWGSRASAFIVPAAIPEGLMLKGPEHPTERLGFEGERAYGNVIVPRGDRLVSVPPWELLPTEQPIDYLRLLTYGR
jgi:hypothetical protein